MYLLLFQVKYSIYYTPLYGYTNYKFSLIYFSGAYHTQGIVLGVVQNTKASFGVYSEGP